MQQNPRLHSIVLKVLAINQGSGKTVYPSAYCVGRGRGREKLKELELKGLEVAPDFFDTLAGFNGNHLTRGV